MVPVTIYHLFPKGACHHLPSVSKRCLSPFARTEAEVGNEQFQAEVLAFHERKKPYYYNAQLVTNILSQMYQTDEKWLEMAELTEYRMNYVQRDSIDYQLAAGYAKKAGDLGKEAYYLVKAEEEKAKEEPVQE